MKTIRLDIEIPADAYSRLRSRADTAGRSPGEEAAMIITGAVPAASQAPRAVPDRRMRPVGKRNFKGCPIADPVTDELLQAIRIKSDPEGALQVWCDWLVKERKRTGAAQDCVILKACRRLPDGPNGRVRYSYGIYLRRLAGTGDRSPAVPLMLGKPVTTAGQPPAPGAMLLGKPWPAAVGA